MGTLSEAHKGVKGDNVQKKGSQKSTVSASDQWSTVTTKGTGNTPLRCLDLFSGTGSVAEAYREKGYEVWTVDVDPRWVLQSRQTS